MTRKAPAGSRNIVIGCSLKPGIVNRVLLNKTNFPLPSISRIVAIIHKASENPKPMPRASAIDRLTLCEDAKASALPSIMQFTTIRGRYMPSDFRVPGHKPENQAY